MNIFFYFPPNAPPPLPCISFLIVRPLMMMRSDIKITSIVTIVYKTADYFESLD